MLRRARRRATPAIAALTTVLAFAGLAGLATACGSDEPTVGERMDKAVDTTAEHLEDAKDKTKDKIDEAKEEVRDEIDDHTTD